ncbi:Targeting protein for Xklp2 [Anthophora quadrimaculata]
MLSPAARVNTKYGQTVTPLTYLKNNLKLPSRKLWKQEDFGPKLHDDIWSQYRNSNQDENWNHIQSPQFVDFSNLQHMEDSYFNKYIAIVSTPNPNFGNGKLPNTVADNDMLLAALNDFRLSDIKHETPNTADKAYENFHNDNKKEEEEYVVHNANHQFDKKTQPERCNKVKKPQNTAVNPFAFHSRDGYKRENKPERINKEEQKIKIFRAKPVPKFVKTETTSFPTTTNNNNNNNNNNEKMNKNPNGNAPKANSYQHIKKSSELWKKPPFVPCLSRKNLERPKTPPLQTMARAQERKRFDDKIKEKERQKEEQREMEIAAKKKQEEKENKLLRMKTVHKAQPIRKYKTDLPKIQKRPLTDPTSPLTLKRRRRV